MFITEKNPKNDFKNGDDYKFKYVGSSGSKKIIMASSIGAASLFFTSEPVLAQTTAASSVEDVGSMIDSISAIAGAAATVVLLAMGVRLAIKQVNRVITKG